jgi:hypothetical protein
MKITKAPGTINFEVSDIQTEPDTTVFFDVDLANEEFRYALTDRERVQIMRDCYEKLQKMAEIHKYFHVDSSRYWSARFIANNNPNGAVGDLDDAYVELFKMFGNAYHHNDDYYGDENF